MNRILCVLLLICAPLAALCAPTRVFTGEHPQFTRMVFRIAPGSEWVLGRNDTGYLLRLPETTTYDLQGFFDRIPKDRIAEVVQQQAGEFAFVVPCECHAEGFLVGDDLLVIDVSDGRPLSGSPFEQRIDIAQSPPTPTGRPYVFPEHAIFPLVGRTPRPLAPVVQPPAPEISEPLERDRSEFDTDLSALETAIAESLAQGLTQGVLAQDLHGAGAMTGINEVARGALRAAQATVPGIGTRTNQDINAVPDDPPIVGTQTGRQCLPNTIFDVPTWGDERPFSVQIALARRDVVTDDGQADETAILRLARLYVYFGFGREALRSLELDGLRSQERTYLAQIASIIDGGEVARSSFSEQVSCPTNVALWAVLANGSGPMDAQPNRAAVLSTFRGLPIHLQRHLGPMLSDRFVGIGDHDAALQALDPGRDDFPKLLGTTLSEAVLNQALGDTMSIEAAVVAAVKENARVTPEVMIRFLEDAVENNRQIDDADFTLADALRFENAHLPIAGDLAYAQAQGYLLMGETNQTRELIGDAFESLGDVRVQGLNDALADFSVQSHDDATFLTFAFDKAPANYSPEIAQRIAERLRALGFPSRADIFAPETTEPTANPVEEHISTSRDMDLGKWQQLNPSSVPAVRSRTMTLPDLELTVDDGSLAHGRALLSQSQETRETLAAILNQIPTLNEP